MSDTHLNGAPVGLSPKQLAMLGIAGVLALATRAKASARIYEKIPFIPSPNFTEANRTARDVRLIVIHTMQAPKECGIARAGATNWFALKSSGVSAHFVVDACEIVQCVKTSDIAWHAKHANGISLGIEHAGSAAQTGADWNDDFNRKMLRRSASLVRSLADAWSIPLVWLTAADVKAGKRGITGHKECTDAFEGGVGHGDPGAGFPRAAYISLCRGA